MKVAAPFLVFLDFLAWREILCRARCGATLMLQRAARTQTASARGSAEQLAIIAKADSCVPQGKVAAAAGAFLHLTAHARLWDPARL
jgi:hypothetical protein